MVILLFILCHSPDRNLLKTLKKPSVSTISVTHRPKLDSRKTKGLDTKIGDGRKRSLTSSGLRVYSMTKSISLEVWEEKNLG